MAWQVTVRSATGSHGPVVLPPDWMPAREGSEPTALEVAAEFAGTMASGHREAVGDAAAGLAFRPPLTITVEVV